MTTIIMAIIMIITKIMIITIIIRCHLELELHTDQFGFSVFTEEMNFEPTNKCTRDYYQFGRFQTITILIMRIIVAVQMKSSFFGPEWMSIFIKSQKMFFF